MSSPIDVHNGHIMQIMSSPIDAHDWRIVDAVSRANVPKNLGPDDTAYYFTDQVLKGERMVDAGGLPIEAALCFFRAFKVCLEEGKPELMNIYKKTLPPFIIELLSLMIECDSSLPDL